MLKKFLLLIIIGLIIFGGVYLWHNFRPENYNTFQSGIYSSGFEVNSFKPDNSDELWWVTGSPEFFKAYDDIVGFEKFNYVPVRVEVLADISKKGKYGHLGAYDREVNILEFRNMELTE